MRFAIFLVFYNKLSQLIASIEVDAVPSFEEGAKLLAEHNAEYFVAEHRYIKELPAVPEEDYPVEEGTPVE